MAKEEKTMSYKQMRKSYAVANASLKTLAIGLITLGVSFLEKGDYELGGLLVTIGWALWMVDEYVA